MPLLVDGPALVIVGGRKKRKVRSKRLDQWRSVKIPWPVNQN